MRTGGTVPPITGVMMRNLLVLFIVLVAGSASAADGDPARGEKIYDRCVGCHSLDRDRTGPRHDGLIGRRVGAVPGFPYSAAMRKAGAGGMTWDEETLDRFLENPTKAMPGTRMGYAGIKDAQERADLIAFLKKAGSGSKRASFETRSPGAPQDKDVSNRTLILSLSKDEPRALRR